MLTTESEASAKRCPLSYAAADGVNYGGFAGTAPGPASPMSGYYTTRNCAPINCIGSACMGWRWHWKVMADGTRHHVFSAEYQRLGYCGNAGKP